MSEKRVELLRPLNGAAVGTEATYPAADAKRLEATGAVKILGDVGVKAEPALENKAERAPANKTALKAR